jgi:HPt (histidine-containing phosphotransfer) domain-containing protein
MHVLPQVAGIDIQEGIVRQGLSWTLFRKMLHDFPEGQRDIVEKLGLSVQKTDFEQVCYYAHSLVGAAGTVAANDLIATARELEIAAKEKQTKNLPDLFDQVKKEYNRICDAIGGLPPMKDKKSVSGETIPPEQILLHLEEMTGFLNDFDPVASSQLMDRLNQLPLSGPVQQQMRRLSKFVNDLQYEKASEVLNIITGILNEEGKA